MIKDLGRVALILTIWIFLVGGAVTNSLAFVLAGVGFAIVYHADSND